MKHSSRGAARISAVWMIAVGVLFLAALVFAIVAQSDLTREKSNAQLARDAEKGARAEAETVAEGRRNVSRLLGWYDPNSTDPASDAEVVKGAMAELRTTFPDISETDGDFEHILPKIREAFDKERATIAELNTRVASLESELQAAKQASEEIRAQKDQLIADGNQKYADLEQRLAERETDLERRLAAAQDQLSERDASLRETVAESETQTRAHNRTVREKDARIGTLADQTRLTRAPFSDLPDGKVVDVSPSTPYAYIDLGADQRVNRGLRFRVESNSPGGARTKAWAEVQKVYPSYAEVRIYDLADRYDPVTIGDKIVNPLFDPTTQRNAYLMGRFSEPYSEAEVANLLQRMGVKVQDRLDNYTNYVILGSELYSDPETGEAYETPKSPTELEDFKRAQNLGVVPITLDQLRDYFRVYAGDQQGSTNGPR